MIILFLLLPIYAHANINTNQCTSGYVVNMIDTYGDGWNGGTLTINGVDHTGPPATSNPKPFEIQVTANVDYPITSITGNFPAWAQDIKIKIGCTDEPDIIIFEWIGADHAEGENSKVFSGTITTCDCDNVGTSILDQCACDCRIYGFNHYGYCYGVEEDDACDEITCSTGTEQVRAQQCFEHCASAGKKLFSIAISNIAACYCTHDTTCGTVASEAYWKTYGIGIGATGDQCETDFDTCSETNVCMHGVCTDTATSFDCTCDACQNGGTLSGPPCSCECPAGYSGDKCQCTTPWQGRNCDECPEGFGTHFANSELSCNECEQPYINKENSNTGSCYIETCPPGQGINNTVWSNTGGNCKVCTYPYYSFEESGEACNYPQCGYEYHTEESWQKANNLGEICISACESEPCQNGGICHDRNQNRNIPKRSYFCACPDGYTGTNCETPIDECFTNHYKISVTYANGQFLYNEQPLKILAGVKYTITYPISAKGGVNHPLRIKVNGTDVGTILGQSDTGTSITFTVTDNYEIYRSNTLTTESKAKPYTPCNNGQCTDGNVSFTCTCDGAWTGETCNECPPGFGWNTTHCAACVKPYTNNLTTHDAECVKQQCGTDKGVITDALLFDTSIHHTNLSNCEECDSGYHSPDTSGICVDINECDENPCNPGTTCSNTLGSHQCLDPCGVNNGDGSSCAGCDGIPNSGLEDDACDICNGDGSSCAGCDGISNSGVTLDACGVCGGNNATCKGCDGISNSGLEDDACGVCNGDNSTCAGCDGEPNSGVVIDDCGQCGGNNQAMDACGECFGDNSTCAGCDGFANSGVVKDGCGVCGGDNSSCAGCDGIPDSHKVIDKCGVCGGNGTSCYDVCGIPNGDGTSCLDLCGVPDGNNDDMDDCGQCGGDNSTCAGCDGVANSGLVKDICGVCGGDGSSCAGRFIPPKPTCKIHCHRHGMQDKADNPKGTTKEECCDPKTITCNDFNCTRIGRTPSGIQGTTIQECCNKPTCACPQGECVDGKCRTNRGGQGLERTQDLISQETNTREALRQHTIIIDNKPQAKAPVNVHQDDTCAQGAKHEGCGTLDTKQDRTEHKRTTLHTGGLGSWTVLIDDDNILTKQTQATDGYDMQCWLEGAWSQPTTMTTGTYQCNQHVILVGSQTDICDPTICIHGECTPDGETYTCTCDQGWQGEMCNTPDNSGNTGTSTSCLEAYNNYDRIAYQNLGCGCTC